MIRNILIFCGSLCFLVAGPGLAQDLPDFSAMATEACLDGAADLPAREACVGASANACMESNSAGYTTVGMGYCFDQELSYWDGRLNVAYGQVMAKDKAIDTEMAEIGSSAPSLSEALRAMQRVWIPFRDASCDYERAKWGGGTGGGPATLSCLMYETARQALILEIRLEHGYN
ncbi:lysozyme inhibitor LprI family protein [Tropicimonas sp. TH_r6]|uniref:lysozyme inhibitor LprI family protein n=1 Tax=Tropicimonas sp. TH_r6 TaxID=3082085 RepID=UPI002952EC98|nr:lysozyme inhibitor LprI family protein [Tropicimonas sp. TH_r6]MDV7142947.1 lysozyme inhibitor LprI family protein [Tropicimonas sp. TH_r6]